MLVPRAGVDDLGQEARAAITFLKYGLELRWGRQGLEIGWEDLSYIKVGEAFSHLNFPHSPPGASRWYRAGGRRR